MKKLILILPLLVACKKETLTKTNDLKACDCNIITEYNKYSNNSFYWADRESTSTFKDYCSNANADWIYDYRGTKRWKQVCK